MKRGQSNYSLAIGINKPKGISSHTALGSLKKSLGEKRIGHAGTLDPNAQGVLVALVGSAARLNQFIVSDSKTYIADIVFGKTTDTDDSQGQILEIKECPDNIKNVEFAKDVLKKFEGPIMQIPPAYCAIKRDGKRAYTDARAGNKIDLDPRPIEVHEAKLLKIFPFNNEINKDVVWQVEFDVSKGTYIRSLARDIGQLVGCGAHLSELIRTRSGNVELSQCVPQDVTIEQILDSALDPVELLNMPHLYILESAEFKLDNGSSLSIFDLNLKESQYLLDPKCNNMIAIVNTSGLKAIYAFKDKVTLVPKCVFQKEIYIGSN